MDKGAFIMHRCHGVTTDISPDGVRAVTKMKATITQRFTIQGCEVDAESDCRFCFFWQKEVDEEFKGEWRARFVRHWYEKDKLICVDPRKYLYWMMRSYRDFRPDIGTWLIVKRRPWVLRLC